jgi:predicted ATPase
MLGDKRFLRTIRPRNILSFGPETPEMGLKSLNVLIGPNGSGKSNLIEVIGLLQSAPGNLLEPIQTGGRDCRVAVAGRRETTSRGDRRHRLLPSSRRPGCLKD